MKNTLQMFTDLHTGFKIPFALDKFSGAQTVGPAESSGTILYGVGLPHTGVEIKETLSTVNEIVAAWYQNSYAGPGSNARN